MHDPRLDQLARQLVRYSTALKKGDRLLIDLFDTPPEMGIALIRAAREAGGLAFVNLNDTRLTRELYKKASDAQYETHSDVLMYQMRKMDAYIAVRGSHNITETADVPPGRMALIMRHLKPVINHRVNKTRWCVLRWPSPSMAQQAGMSTESFEDFYFRVCLLNYKGLLPAMRSLKRLMDQTNRVQIKGPGTDLRFSMKGIKAVVCGGRNNIPDGECFAAPVRESVEGIISYNAPTIYQGVAFDSIRLEFKRGRIVKASANNTEAINRILDSDAGARYVGEFALGFNPEIRHPMRDILFDEKIAGSFHFTPGQAYEGETDNGNRSQVHWDMVSIQRDDYGGGEIYFDDKLIRKNGRFLAKPLQILN
ncbi:MAG: aminopeptidase [Verrucomicrobiales bacterium]